MFHSIESIEPLVRDREARRRALGATRARERSPRQARCDAQLRSAAPFNALALRLSQSVKGRRASLASSPADTQAILSD